MSTLIHQEGGRRRRKNHGVEFRAKIIELCSQPGISVSSVARQYDLNVNVVYRWLRDRERSSASPAPTPVAVGNLGTNDFIQIPISPTPDSGCATISLNLSKADLKIHMDWPMQNALECIHLLKALLK